MQRIARGRFIRNCSSLQGWAAPRAFEVIVKRAERVPRLVRLMILFLFGEQNELYPRPWWWYLAVIYDFRASTCILRPRTSMHLRVHQALVIGRAFVRYHPYPLRFFVSASSFHFFSFVFFFFLLYLCARCQGLDLRSKACYKAFEVCTCDIESIFFSNKSWNLFVASIEGYWKIRIPNVRNLYTNLCMYWFNELYPCFFLCLFYGKVKVKVEKVFF